MSQEYPAQKLYLWAVFSFLTHTLKDANFTRKTATCTKADFVLIEDPSQPDQGQFRGKIWDNESTSPSSPCKQLRVLPAALRAGSSPPFLLALACLWDGRRVGSAENV